MIMKGQSFTDTLRDSSTENERDLIHGTSSVAKEDVLEEQQPLLRFAETPPVASPWVVKNDLSNHLGSGFMQPQEMILHGKDKYEAAQVQKEMKTFEPDFIRFLPLVTSRSMKLPFLVSFGAIFVMTVNWLVNAYDLTSMPAQVRIPEVPMFPFNGSAPPHCGEATMRINHSTRPQNLHIAMIGDSVSRYMYLSLAHYLRWGFWECDDHVPSIVLEKQYKSWTHFYNYTKHKLSPYEECDCWRYGGLWDKLYENRYYYDPIMNNSLSVFLKHGPFAIRGHWNATDVHKEHTLKSEFDGRYQWEYRQNWAQLIQEHIAQLPHRPQFVVFNAGLWHEHGLDSVAMQDAIFDTLSRNDMIGVYRTTSAMRGRVRSPNSYHDESYCRNALLCLNISWTFQTPDHSYVDIVHFTASFYNQMNAQLLHMLLGHQPVTKKCHTV